MNVRPIDPVADRALRELPDGMLEREAEVAFHNLERLYGFDEALERMAEIILKRAPIVRWPK